MTYFTPLSRFFLDERTLKYRSPTTIAATINTMVHVFICYTSVSLVRAFRDGTLPARNNPYCPVATLLKALKSCIMPGPIKTTSNSGNMKSTRGKTSLTATFLAASSALLRRFVRSESA